MANEHTRRFPASHRVAQALQERLAGGYYLSGSWLPAERSLAAEFGVSRPVVRAAVARLVGEGLLVRRAGCRPLVAAGGALRPNPIEERRALPTIAAVLPQHPTYVSAQAYLRGIHAALQQSAAPYHLAVFDTHSAAPTSRGAGPVPESATLERLREEGVAGVIVWHLSGRESLPALRRLLDDGTSVVFIDRHPRDLDCDFVGVDNPSAMRSAIEHLVGLGHRRIAYLSISEDVSTVREREEGYREAMCANGLGPAPELLYVTPQTLRAELAAAAEHLLALAEPPTAVAAVNDLHAFAFIRELSARGLRVPEDMSVMGFDDIESYSPHPATLTTVHQPFFQIGQRAAQLLLRRLAPGAAPSRAPRQHVMLATSLVARSTCRPLPALGPEWPTVGAPEVEITQARRGPARR